MFIYKNDHDMIKRALLKKLLLLIIFIQVMNFIFLVNNYISFS
jgi:hypothetical protein